MLIVNIFHLRRSAVTLLEVIFSIGVILIGLLGLLSILPLAGRRAQDAVSLAEAAAIGDSIANEIAARKLVASGALITMTNGTVGLATVTSGSGIYLDPLYVAQQRVDLGTLNVTAAGKYIDSNFPYYVNRLDPLQNPSDPATDPMTDPQKFWPAPMPRLTRVGLATSGISNVVDLEIARTFSQSSNDLIVERDKDRSKAAELRGLKGGSGASDLPYAARVTSGEFSWTATICPMPDGANALLTVVVFRSRDFMRDFPTSTVTEQDENGNAERVAYVSSSSGFSGGAGGQVFLVGSNNVSPRISPNDWVMLSQNSARDVSHRWYRVVAVDREPEVLTTTQNHPNRDPELGGSAGVDDGFVPTPSGTTVWRRTVYLDGPERRNFGYRNDNPANDVGPPPTIAARYSNNVMATIVTGVVSVTERVVALRDL